MISFIYNIFFNLIQILLKVVPLQKGKLRKLKNGQSNVWGELEQISFDRPIWFHVASAGEFEQAKSLIELFKENNYQVIVSFFSPSGYEAQKNSSLLDTVVYLPLDTPSNAKRFIEIVDPQLAVFVKYDFWLNYMKTLNTQKIPMALISGVFTKNHFFFQWFGKAHLNEFKQFNYIGVQDEDSRNVLAKYGIESEVSGDTRIDRSVHLPLEEFSDKKIEDFIDESKITAILGSVWKKDLDIWRERFTILEKRGINLILAPHELDEEFLVWIENEFNAVRYSEYKERGNSNVLLIDKIGLLKYIYRYGDFAYIGGGFGKSIHNTLEPASYGIPVIFGPNHKKFMEALIMQELEGAFTVHSSQELMEVLSFLYVKENCKQAGENALSYLQQHKGGSQLAYKRLEEVLKHSPNH